MRRLRAPAVQRPPAGQSVLTGLGHPVRQSVLAGREDPKAQAVQAAHADPRVLAPRDPQEDRVHPVVPQALQILADQLGRARPAVPVDQMDPARHGRQVAPAVPQAPAALCHPRSPLRQVAQRVRDHPVDLPHLADHGYHHVPCAPGFPVGLDRPVPPSAPRVPARPQDREGLLDHAPQADPACPQGQNNPVGPQYLEVLEVQPVLGL